LLTPSRDLSASEGRESLRRSSAPYHASRSLLLRPTYSMDSQGISILGSTGSIGCNALSVVESFADERFRVVALAAGRNVERLVAQVERHRPELVAVDDEA